MAQSQSPDPAFVEDDTIRYRSISRLAVAGLLLGIASPLAILGPLLWLLPALAVAVSGLALASIRRRSEVLGGRGVALIGLALAILFGTVTLSHTIGFSYFLRRDASTIGTAMFDYLSNNEPHKAHALTLAPQQRQPLDSRLWEYYHNTEHARKGLQEFVEQPVVRTLLALGPQATVRPLGTEYQGTTSGGESTLSQIYAVTYDDGGPQTFFVQVVVKRLRGSQDGSTGWQIEVVQVSPHPFQPMGGV